MNSLVLPMALSIAGALVYVFAMNAKLVEIGRIVFFLRVLLARLLTRRPRFAILTDACPTRRPGWRP